jgi:hypothetical protein
MSELDAILADIGGEDDPNRKNLGRPTGKSGALAQGLPK